jgi:hypothetical protein
MPTTQELADGKKAAVATYMEQTKLLVTLASAFLFAPAGLVALLKDGKDIHLVSAQVEKFMWAEGLFILSVLAGYVVMATIAGYQAEGEHNVYRPATRIASIIQFFAYLGGLGVFAYLGKSLVSAAV